MGKLQRPALRADLRQLSGCIVFVHAGLTAGGQGSSPAVARLLACSFGRERFESGR